MRLEIVQVEPNTTRLDLDGRMDAAGCEKIETAFTAAASAAGGHLLVNLAQVNYIGSLGIRLLISTARIVTRRGRRIVICGAQSQPRDVFETVALGDLIPIVADEPAAKAILAA
jgi:anti-anti-sigma factor